MAGRSAGRGWNLAALSLDFSGSIGLERSLAGRCHFESDRECFRVRLLVAQAELWAGRRLAQESQSVSVSRPLGVVLDHMTFIVEIDRSSLVFKGSRINDHQVIMRARRIRYGGRQHSMVRADDDMIRQVQMES